MTLIKYMGFADTREFFAGDTLNGTVTATPVNIVFQPSNNHIIDTTLSAYSGVATAWFNKILQDPNFLNITGLSMPPASSWEADFGGLVISQNAAPYSTANITAIVDAYLAMGGSGSGFLSAAANLSDLVSAAAARTNLGLGTAALSASSAFDTAGLAATEAARAEAAEAVLRATINALGATAWAASTAYIAEAIVTNGGILYQAPSGGVPSRSSFTAGDWTELSSIALPVGTTSGTVAAGNDTRITGALQTSGGTMTGALTLSGAPTSSLHAATKAYVDSAIGGGTIVQFSPIAKTASYTAAAWDLAIDNSAAGMTMTLPATMPAAGVCVAILRGTDTATMTVTPNSGQTINKSATSVTANSAGTAAVQSGIFMSDGASNWMIVGATSTDWGKSLTVGSTFTSLGALVIGQSLLMTQTTTTATTGTIGATATATQLLDATSNAVTMSLTFTGTRTFVIKRIDAVPANLVTLTPSSGTIEGGSSYQLSPGQAIICTLVGTDYKILSSYDVDIQTSVARTTSATVLAGETTVFSGSTAAQTMTLPVNEPPNTMNIVINVATVAVSLAAGAGDTINNFGTVGTLSIPAQTMAQVVFNGTVWYVDEMGSAVSAEATRAMAAEAALLPKSGGTMTGLLTLSGAPTSSLHAATKAYVDASGGSGSIFTVAAPSADNTGATDTPILAAALAAGTPIIMHPGVYFINALITHANDQPFAGSGGGRSGASGGTVIRVATGHASAAVLLNGTGPVRDFLVDGNSVASAPLQRGLTSGAGSYGRFDNIWVTGSTADGFTIMSPQNDKYYSCGSFLNGRDNLYIDGGAGGLEFWGWQDFSATRYGIHLDGLQVILGGYYDHVQNIRFYGGITEQGGGTPTSRVYMRHAVDISFPEMNISGLGCTGPCVDLDVGSCFAIDLSNSQTASPGTATVASPCIAVNQGDARTITGVTTANPGVVHCVAHGYQIGQSVTIAGVAGATQANGTFIISNVGDADHFTIPANVTGTYSSGGTARAQTAPYPTLTTLSTNGHYFESGYISLLLNVVCKVQCYGWMGDGTATGPASTTSTDIWLQLIGKDGKIYFPTVNTGFTGDYFYRYRNGRVELGGFVGGSFDPITITAISLANPGVVTTAAVHGYVNGQQVTIAGCTGTVEANGTWTVTVLSTTTFSIPVHTTNAYAASSGNTSSHFPVPPLPVGYRPVGTLLMPCLIGGGIGLIEVDSSGNVSITTIMAGTTADPGAYLDGVSFPVN